MSTFDSVTAAELERHSPGIFSQFDAAVQAVEKAIQVEFIDKWRADWSATPRAFKAARLQLRLSVGDIETLRAAVKANAGVLRRYTRAEELRDRSAGHVETVKLRKAAMEASWKRLDAVKRHLAKKSLLRLMQ